jgi:hypothetical protein
MIPVWGSGRAAINDFQNGNYGWATFNAAMAVSDVFLVKSIATAGIKGAWKFGSHSWRATRDWYGQRYGGRWFEKASLPRGVDVHHWLFHRNQGIGRFVPNAIKNQPWNLKVFHTQQLHFNAGHGWWHLDSPPYSRLGQFWYGTPDWTKAILGSGGGRIVEGIAR